MGGRDLPCRLHAVYFGGTRGGSSKNYSGRSSSSFSFSFLFSFFSFSLSISLSMAKKFRRGAKGNLWIAGKRVAARPNTNTLGEPAKPPGHGREKELIRSDVQLCVHGKHGHACVIFHSDTPLIRVKY